MNQGNRPLWAPWRIEFIREAKKAECFLCNYDAQDAPEQQLIVAHGVSAYVILNRFPYNAGHLLIAPYRHTGNLAELTCAERSELMELCVHAQKVLDTLMKPAAYNVGFNLGAAAGAGVAEHLHMHIVPRWAGDTNFMPVLADCRCVPEALEATAGMIRDAWGRV